jgi:Na+-transporting NADH:ubiquinone oxidoreductase subunit B
VFNPALTGRAFVYVSFGTEMTARWTKPFHKGAAGFTHWANTAPDAITQATPGMLLKSPQTGTFGIGEMLLGIEPGVIGGTGAILAVLCGLYIVWKKAASYRIVAGGVAGFLLAQTAAWLSGAPGAADPAGAAATGSFLFGVFFYATDPVTACQTDAGRWVYGALVGVLSSVISVFSVWPAGTMFAVLLGNVFAPLIDMGARRLERKRS